MAFVGFEAMTKAMSEELRVRYREQLPFASVVALSRTANKARDRLKDHMRKAFDNPTPYALNAARAVPATKKSMASSVLLREFASKGTPADRFLGPEIVGGARRQKRSERALAAIGAIGAGGYVVPGSGAKLDGYGNQSRGELVKILSVLKAFGEQGYRANRAKGWAKSTRRGQIFVVRSGSNRAGLKPGVYRRGAGNTVVPLLAFLKTAPHYRVRLPFDVLVQRDAEQIFPAELEAALHEFGDE